jgi:hypothetical protein
MAKYHVIWEIDIDDAESPKEAAERALAIHRNPESIATFFEVTDEQGQTTCVDLEDEIGPCVDCGTQCYLDGSLAVLCPKCDGVTECELQSPGVQ